MWSLVVSKSWFSVVIGVAMVVLPLPIAIAQYPTSRQLVCKKSQVKPPIADCFIELKTLSGWGNYRENHINIKAAKVLTVNAKSSSERGGKNKRSEPLIVKLYPSFLVDRTGKNYKIEKIEPYEPTATIIVDRINQFFEGTQAKLEIDIMDMAYNQSPDGGGSSLPSRKEHLIHSAFGVLMISGLGLAVLLKQLANFLKESLGEEEKA
jgi:hypothetical protein